MNLSRKQFLHLSTAAALFDVRTGKLRALGVTTAARAAVLPDVPSIGEFVPGYDASGWYGVGGPRDMPATTVERLNKEINASLADSSLTRRLADLGYTTMGSSPAEFAKFIADETESAAASS